MVLPTFAAFRHSCFLTCNPQHNHTRRRCGQLKHELSVAIKSSWNSTLHHWGPEAHTPLTTWKRWLAILPSGMSGLSHKDGHKTVSFFWIQVLPTSLTNDDLFWRTYTLFNSKDARIEMPRPVVSITNMGCGNSSLWWKFWKETLVCY